VSVEDQIKVKLYRSFDGLIVKVWADPKVEEFIRSLSVDTPVDLKVLGRYWSALPEAPPLMVYRVADLTLMSGVLGSGDCTYRLDQPGQALSVIDHGTLSGIPRTVINMGFLRLVGISQGNGITFKVSGVYPSDHLRSMRDAIGAASRSFYITYMKPMKLRVVLSTEPEDIVCK
jgi:hypothetical protein